MMHFLPAGARRLEAVQASTADERAKHRCMMQKVLRQSSDARDFSSGSVVIAVCILRSGAALRAFPSSRHDWRIQFLLPASQSSEEAILFGRTSVS